MLCPANVAGIQRMLVAHVKLSFARLGALPSSTRVHRLSLGSVSRVWEGGREGGGYFNFFFFLQMQTQGQEEEVGDLSLKVGLARGS